MCVARRAPAAPAHDWHGRGRAYAHDWHGLPGADADAVGRQGRTQTSQQAMRRAARKHTWGSRSGGKRQKGGEGLRWTLTRCLIGIVVKTFTRLSASRGLRTRNHCSCGRFVVAPARGPAHVPARVPAHVRQVACCFPRVFLRRLSRSAPRQIRRGAHCWNFGNAESAPWEVLEILSKKYCPKKRGKVLES